jgi:hypothetical protein
LIAQEKKRNYNVAEFDDQNMSEEYIEKMFVHRQESKSAELISGS